MADDLDPILRGCRAGDRAAQRRLYDRFHRTVYRLAARLAGAGEAADLTQEVFLRVFTALDTFRGAAGFSTWLYRVAVNVCLRSLRDRRPRPEPLAQEPACPGAGPEGVVEQADLLERALAGLEAPLRAIFLLREVEGLSYSEIAGVLGVPPGTVASQLSRARSRLLAFGRRVEQGHRDGLS
jgi:RNA polymerase sigma-70 factor (ECF subfamily)